jgi:membrane protein
MAERAGWQPRHPTTRHAAAARGGGIPWQPLATPNDERKSDDPADQAPQGANGMAKAASPYPTLLAAAALAGLLIEARGRRGVARAASGDTAVPRHRPHPGGKDQFGSTHDERQAGQDALSPADIPFRGWWHVLKRVAAGFLEDRVMAEAAGVTFYALLAIFPAIAVLISVYGLFADPGQIGQQLDSLSGIIPGGGLDIIRGQVTALTSSGHHALSVGLLIGLATSLWSANAGVKSFFDALNVVYHEHEKRSFLWLTLVSFCFTLGVLAFLVMALLGVVVVPIVLSFVGLGAETDLLIEVARWPVMLVLVAVALSLLYRYGPSRRRARWQWVSWGSGFAAFAWIAVSLAFSYYVANFGSYNKTYGSLGAVVGFMTWIWISAMVVLLGAELNAELEQQTNRDSTVGPEKPPGTRGAFKADVKS